MTQEEKQLLLKDLCARLPYGVKLNNGLKLRSIDTLTQIVSCSGSDKKIDCIKPYLRPMSSMSEEEKIELCTISYAPDEMKTIDEKLYVIKTNARYAADFYNEHHFDFRGLIPMGLALEAPDDMYKQ